MGKKRDWFWFVKKALTPESKKDQKESSKSKKKWQSKTKDSGPAVPLPQETETETKTEEPELPPPADAKPAEAENEPKKHTYFVALATAMAAAAAVAASKATAEAVHVASLQRILSERTAATKIQTAFRGYLARRALPELRRSERLKSMIEGQSVKEQAKTALRCMQTKGGLQSRIRGMRLRMLEENQILHHHLQQKRHKEHDKFNASMGGEWHDGRKSKEQSEAIKQYKQEAAMRRERALAYAFTRQRSWKVTSKAANQTLMDQNTPHWGWSWLERWMAARPWDIPCSSPNNASVNTLASSSISNNDNKPSPTPSKPTPPPPSKIPSFSSLSSQIRQPSPRGTRPGGDECSTPDRDRRRQSSIGGFSSAKDDKSVGSSAEKAPSWMKQVRTSQLSSSLRHDRIPEKGVAGIAKKRLSFPATAGKVRI
ncbi:hypothetical protein ES319_A05G312300v1 [Gossypium barbadense]|uniref:DUF4005 domain-containing protein n=1 Tax=Gossypium barbadense TaxID=3634 RepID=A0A5J5VY85_GOSBA|nr:hypothetical protein ES319_A05G312300v1 [Gossypium barbadense]